MLPFDVRPPPDRLAIGDLRERSVDFDPVARREAGDGDVEVGVAETRQHGLVGGWIAFDTQGRIVLDHLRQGGRQLLFVVLRLREHGVRHGRAGHGHRSQGHLGPGRHQGVSGQSGLQLCHSGYVAGLDTLQVLVVPAPHGEDIVHPAVGTDPTVLQCHVQIDVSAEHPEERNPADVGIGHRLEDVGDDTGVGECVTLQQRRDGALHWPRAVVDDELRQAVDADEARSRTTQDGKGAAGHHAGVHALDELFARGFLALEVLLQHLVVRFNHCLDERRVQFLDLGLDRLGEVLLGCHRAA